MKTLSVFAGLMLASSFTLADSSTLDAAIGGGRYLSVDYWIARRFRD